MGCLDKLRGNSEEEADHPGLLNLETPQEYKERWRSIYIFHFTMFLMSLGFGIILTGVWPYLDKLDPTAGKEFMGYIVAANPFGQMVFSPLIGWWSNHTKTVHIPMLLTVALFAFSSALYSILDLFTSYRKYWMVVTRLLVGISSANVVVCRSYLSAATMLKERRNAVAVMAFAQVMGFMVGPAIQAAMTPLGDGGVKLAGLSIDMYTAAGWLNCALGIINFILFLPSVFKQHKIAAKEAMIIQNAESEKATWKGKSPDYTSVWTLIVASFILVFNFVLLETLATVLTMEQFAWTKEEAVYYMGILMTVGGVIATLTFASIGPLSRLIGENKTLIWGGFFFMVLGRVVYIPWGVSPAQIAYLPDSNTSTLAVSNDTGISNWRNATDQLGCPSTQEWCLYTPGMTLAQFLLGYVFTAMGYPIGISLLQTIYSKVLGPRPQGVWMGWMTGSSCLSRVMGPVFIGVIYTRYGTMWTFGLTTVMMVVTLVWLIFMDKRLQTAVEEHIKRTDNVTAEPGETVKLTALESNNS